MTNISMEKKYTTRDGRPVRLLCVDGPGGSPIVGIIDSEYQFWHEDGRVCDKRSFSHFDLIEVKTKRTGWINIYRDDKDSPLYVGGGGKAFSSKEDADNYHSMAVCRRIACIKIEWEE